jgi:acyl-CoA synthetase (NDP forming)
VLDAASRARIDAHLPSYGTSQNPIDATAQAVHKIGYAGLARLVIDSPLIDALIVVITARSAKNLERQRADLARLAAQAEKPVLLWSYTLPAPPASKLLRDLGYPLFTDIRNCARALAVMADWRHLRQRFLAPVEISTQASGDRAAAAAVLAKGEAVLCEWEARPLLAAYGIATTSPGVLVESAEAASAAAAAIGKPVALKLQSPDILHKTELGAVRLNLGPHEVAAAYASIIAAAKRQAPSARIRGVLVQAMAPPGLEVILGIKRDPTFGPLLLVGLGGVHVEVFKDVVVAPVPFAAAEARALLSRLKSAALLKAFRGRPAADIDALVDAMLRLGRLAKDFEEVIAEIDLNPLLVHAEGQGISVVDALVVTDAGQRHRPGTPPTSQP